MGRVVNLAMPLTLGRLISILEGRVDQSPWPYLFGYVGLRFLQGSGGLSAIRDVCPKTFTSNTALHSLVSLGTSYAVF